MEGLEVAAVMEQGSDKKVSRTEAVAALVAMRTAPSEAAYVALAARNYERVVELAKAETAAAAASAPDADLNPVQVRAVLDSYNRSPIGRAVPVSVQPWGGFLGFGVEDAITGLPTHISHNPSCGRDYNTAQKLRALILSFLDHELREWLKVGSTPLFDPHRRHRMYAIPCVTNDARVHLAPEVLR
jgi:hypothetical protein